MEHRQVTVITHDGYKGGERPSSFVIAGRTVDVVEITMLRVE